MRLVHEHYPALSSLIKSQPASPRPTNSHQASPSLLNPHQVSLTVGFTLILRNLFGSGSCACGTEEHYLQLWLCCRWLSCKHSGHQNHFSIKPWSYSVTAPHPNIPLAYTLTSLHFWFGLVLVWAQRPGLDRRNVLPAKYDGRKHTSLWDQNRIFCNTTTAHAIYLDQNI